MSYVAFSIFVVGVGALVWERFTHRFRDPQRPVVRHSWPDDDTG